jgi:hypothetical protein
MSYERRRIHGAVACTWGSYVYMCVHVSPCVCARACARARQTDRMSLSLSLSLSLSVCVWVGGCVSGERKKAWHVEIHTKIIFSMEKIIQKSSFPWRKSMRVCVCCVHLRG